MCVPKGKIDLDYPRCSEFRAATALWWQANWIHCFSTQLLSPLSALCSSCPSVAARHLKPVCLIFWSRVLPAFVYHTALDLIQNMQRPEGSSFLMDMKKLKMSGKIKPFKKLKKHKRYALISPTVQFQLGGSSELTFS